MEKAKTYWDSLSIKQKDHFLKDHKSEIKRSSWLSWLGKDFDSLPDNAKKVISKHVEEGLYKSGGSFTEFLEKAKKSAVKAGKSLKQSAESFSKTAKSKYSETKKAVNEKVKDQKRKIALDVLDETKDKVKDNKYKLTLKGAQEIIKDKYAKGGTLESMEKQLPILELQNVNGYKAYYDAKKTLEKANKEHDNTFQSKKVIDNYSQLLLQAKETYKNNLQKHLGEKMAKGSTIDKKKKTDFTISEYIKIQRDKLREHNAKAHEEDRLDWSDWKSELTNKDTEEYGIYYNRSMLDSNGDRGAFEYLPTNKNYSEDEYAKGGDLDNRQNIIENTIKKMKKQGQGILITKVGNDTMDIYQKGLFKDLDESFIDKMIEKYSEKYATGGVFTTGTKINFYDKYYDKNREGTIVEQLNPNEYEVATSIGTKLVDKKDILNEVAEPDKKRWWQFAVGGYIDIYTDDLKQILLSKYNDETAIDNFIRNSRFVDIGIEYDWAPKKVASYFNPSEWSNKMAKGGGVGEYYVKYDKFQKMWVVFKPNGTPVNEYTNKHNAIGVADSLNEKNKMAKGGHFENENREMVLNNNKQIAHHTKELEEAVKDKHVPAWVVAKVNRSASDLSDATHYMEGHSEQYAKGSNVKTDNLQELKSLNKALQDLGMKYQSERSEFIDRYENELNDIVHFDYPKTMENWKESLSDRMSSALSQYRIYPERYATGTNVSSDWTDMLSPDEVEFACSVMNRIVKPGAYIDNENLKHTNKSVLAKVINKNMSIFSDEGKKLALSLISKLN